MESQSRTWLSDWTELKVNFQHVWTQFMFLLHVELEVTWLATHLVILIPSSIKTLFICFYLLNFNYFLLELQFPEIFLGCFDYIYTAAAAAKSLQSCPTLCDPIDGSQPGSPVPRILQARTLEWVAISFSNAWKWKVKVKSFSRVWLLATPWTAAYQAPQPMGFSRQEYWSGVPLHSRIYIYIYMCVCVCVCVCALELQVYWYMEIKPVWILS